LNEFAARKILRIKIEDTEFTFRPLSITRVLAETPLEPAWYKGIMAKGAGVEVSGYELVHAKNADVRAFVTSLICNASISPKIVPFEPDPDSDAVWIELFTDHQRGQITDALEEFTSANKGDIEVIAPFRHVPNADDPSGQV